MSQNIDARRANTHPQSAQSAKPPKNQVEVDFPDAFWTKAKSINTTFKIVGGWLTHKSCIVLYCIRNSNSNEIPYGCQRLVDASHTIRNGMDDDDSLGISETRHIALRRAATHDHRSHDQKDERRTRKEEVTHG
jgi:hypothetical protein